MSSSSSSTSSLLAHLLAIIILFTLLHHFSPSAPTAAALDIDDFIYFDSNTTTNSTNSTAATNSSSTGAAAPGTTCSTNASLCIPPDDPDAEFTPYTDKPNWIFDLPENYCWGSERYNYFSTQDYYYLYQDSLDATTGYSKLGCAQPGESVSRYFNKGDPSPPICIQFSFGNHIFKTAFYPKVDSFALLQVQNSLNHSLFTHFTWGFKVEIAGVQSDTRSRFGRYSTYPDGSSVDGSGSGSGSGDSGSGGSVDIIDTCLVVPFWTIVVKLNKGVVQSIKFDDDCSLCDNDHCINGNCAQDITKCAQSSAQDATDCDFKLYVGWQGTDSAGNGLTSAGRRLSQFRRWSLSAAYNSASNFAGEGLPVAPPSDDGPSTAIGN